MLLDLQVIESQASGSPSMVLSPVALCPLSADPVGNWSEGTIYWNYATARLRAYSAGAWMDV